MIANVLNTSESIWRYPVFVFICYVSVHLEISATVVRPPPEERPIRVRTTSFRGCGIGQGSVAKTQEVEGMSGSWRADRWLGTISLGQGCFQISQVCGFWSDDGLTRSNPHGRLTGYTETTRLRLSERRIGWSEPPDCLQSLRITSSVSKRHSALMPVSA